MNCKNCDATIDEQVEYCYNCGAKVIRNRLTLKNLFQHFSEQFLNYDNKFLKTFLALFTRPDDVIVSYIHGTRKKYVNVVSYFAIALTISGLQLLILDKFFPEAMDLSAFEVDGSTQNSEDMMPFMRDYQSLLMMLNVPFYALMSYLVFFTLRRYNYTEHLVIFMYILSQLTFVGSCVSISSAYFGLSIGHSSLILLPIQFFYSIYCLQKIFMLSTKGVILRTLLFLLIVILASIIFIIISIIIAYFDGSLQEAIEAQKALKDTSLNQFFFHELNLI